MEKQFERRVIRPRSFGAQNKGYGDGGASYSKRALKGVSVSSGAPSEDSDANNYTLRQ